MYNSNNTDNFSDGHIDDMSGEMSEEMQANAWKDYLKRTEAAKAEDNAPEDIRPICSVAKGDYVRRIRKNGKAMLKVYRKDVYDSSRKKYWLDDTDDISNAIAVKPDTLVLVGFTY